MQVVVVVLASVTVKLSATDEPWVEPFGGDTIETDGAIESTVNVVLAEPEPAALVAVTAIVWLPCARPV